MGQFRVTHYMAGQSKCLWGIGPVTMGRSVTGFSAQTTDLVKYQADKLIPLIIVQAHTLRQGRDFIQGCVLFPQPPPDCGPGVVTQAACPELLIQVAVDKTVQDIFRFGKGELVLHFCVAAVTVRFISRPVQPLPPFDFL